MPFKKVSFVKKICLSVTGFLFTISAQGQTLQQAIQATIDSNPEVLIITNQRSAIGEELDQAEAGYLPTLNVAGGVGYELSDTPATRANPNSSGDSNDLTRQEASLEFNQNLFNGFATKNEVSRNKARVDASAYTVQGTAEKLALDVTESYLNVMRLKQEVEIARQNVDAHLKTQSMIGRRTETGVSRRADLVQADGRLALASSNLQSVQSNYRDSITTFYRLVGEMPENLSLPSVPNSLMPKSEQEAVEIALENNPTFKSSKADIRAANAQHEASKAPFWPTFDFTALGNWDNDLDGVEGENNNYLAIVRGRYNLFNGGADMARYNQTAYQIQEAQEISNRTMRQTIESMRFSWNALQTAIVRLKNLKAHDNAARETVELYRKQFQIGQRTLLDLLDAENESFEASTNYLRGRYDLLFAKYRVLDDMGRLLAFEKIRLPKQSNIPTYTTDIFG